MTGLKRLLTCALAGAFLSTVSSCGEGGTPLDPELTEQEEQVFNVLTGCSGACVGGFVDMIDGFNGVLVLLASGVHQQETKPFFHTTDGAFGFDMDMDGISGDEIQFRGSINPFTSACRDGMVKGDVCLAEWEMFNIQTSGKVGDGTFSIVGMGDAMYPYSTPSYRVTIVKEEPWIETADGCRLDISMLDIMVHPFGTPQLMSVSMGFKITTAGLVDEVNGGMYYSYDPTPGAAQTANLQGQYETGGTTTDFSCSIDFDTFALSCS